MHACSRSTGLGGGLLLAFPCVLSQCGSLMAGYAPRHMGTPPQQLGRLHNSCIAPPHQTPCARQASCHWWPVCSVSSRSPTAIQCTASKPHGMLVVLVCKCRAWFTPPPSPSSTCIQQLACIYRFDHLASLPSPPRAPRQRRAGGARGSACRPAPPFDQQPAPRAQRRCAVHMHIAHLNAPAC